ncbi:MAG: ester cyclase [Actinomycetota bacterium]
MSAGDEATPAEVLRTYLEEVGAKGRIELIDDLAHDDMVDEANQMFGGPPGKAGLVAHVVGFRKNVTDLEVTIERVVGDTTTAIGWWRFEGTHSGPWLGLPATNERIRGTVISRFDVDGGKVSRYRLFLWTDLDGGRTLDTSIAGGSEAS